MHQNNRMTGKKKQYWNLKYQISDSIFTNVYDLNIMNAETS